MSPAFARLPLPTIRSCTTSSVGGSPLPFGTFGLRSGFASPADGLTFFALGASACSGSGAASASSGSASGSSPDRSCCRVVVAAAGGQQGGREQDEQDRKQAGRGHHHQLGSGAGLCATGAHYDEPARLGCRVHGARRGHRAAPGGRGRVRGQHRRALVDAARPTGRVRDGDRPPRDGAGRRRPRPPAALAQRLLPATAACGPDHRAPGGRAGGPLAHDGQRAPGAGRQADRARRGGASRRRGPARCCRRLRCRRSSRLGARLPSVPRPARRAASRRSWAASRCSGASAIPPSAGRSMRSPAAGWDCSRSGRSTPPPCWCWPMRGTRRRGRA